MEARGQHVDARGCASANATRRSYQFLLPTKEKHKLHTSPGFTDLLQYLWSRRFVSW